MLTMTQWLIALGVLALLLLVATVHYRARFLGADGQHAKKIAELQSTYARQLEELTPQIVSVPKDIQFLMPPARIAVGHFDKTGQPGEWKFHQAYAALLKTDQGRQVADEKWKAGLAIHLALAERRSIDPQTGLNRVAASRV